MELNGSTSYEQETLVAELIQGMELSKQLKAQMSLDIQGGETKGMLAERIHSCLEKALLALNWGGAMEQSHQHRVPTNMTPESPLSVIGSPKSEDFNAGFYVPQDTKDLSRKRKMMPTWTDQVKANSDSEGGAPEDGFSWRKYGQKDILGATYPRSYYRCTYRKMQGCNATRYVQRNNEDPTQFDITYKGAHTCTLARRSKSAPTSPDKKERNIQSNFFFTQYQQQPDMLLNFQTGLRVDVQNLQDQDTGFFFPTSEPIYGNNAFTPSTLSDSPLYNSYPQPLMPSPATSESTYFSTSPSGTNSPIIGIDVPLDQMLFNPNFLFEENQAFPTSFCQDKV